MKAIAVSNLDDQALMHECEVKFQEVVRLCEGDDAQAMQLTSNCDLSAVVDLLVGKGLITRREFLEAVHANRGALAEAMTLTEDAANDETPKAAN